jgi:Tol biopolymer transport system component
MNKTPSGPIGCRPNPHFSSLVRFRSPAFAREFVIGLLMLISADAGIAGGNPRPRTLRTGEPQPLSRVVDYEPAWSPQGTQIAFVSNRSGYLKIYTMRADGTDLRQLTQGTDEDDAPAWSPDGSRIAYVSTRDGNEEIYVMRADGAEQTRLTRHAAADIHPNWSADGSFILWNSSRNSLDTSHPGTFEIFMMRPDGSDVRRLTRGGVATYASWSPDGTRILFRKQLEDGNSEIFVMKPDGSDSKNLTRNPAFDGWPSWSRDGTRILFAREQGDEEARIYSMNADGSDIQLLVSLPGRCTNPRWSPKGDRIVFSRRWEREIRLYVVDISLPGREPPARSNDQAPGPP